MTYNPQEWAGNRQPAETRTRRDCYGEPLQTPPPPYTIPGEQRGSITSALSRPATFVSPEVSRTTTPVPVPQENGTNGETGFAARPKPTVITSTAARQSYDPRKAAHLSGGQGEYNPASTYQQYRPQSTQAASSSGALSFASSNRVSHDGTSIPPPPPRKTPPNINTAQAQLSSMPALGYARRSTSAGPTPTTTGPGVLRTTRTLSGGTTHDVQEWNGMSLPGPPNAPPPASSRSRSASAHAETSTIGEGGPRSRPPRLAIRNSNLTPIPATPNSVVSGTSTRQMPVPLRIDTGMNSRLGKEPAQAHPSNTDQDGSRVPQAGPLSLARRSAVRGPAARSSQPFRSRSKSQTGQSEIYEPPSTTLSNNPWASALEQTRSPQNETLPESAVLPGLNPVRFVNGTALGKSHTPPTTPSIHPQKLAYDTSQPQPKVLPTPPLSQKPLLSANSITDPAQMDNLFIGLDDGFLQQANARHFAFLQSEQQAATDTEKLSLFVKFLHQESLIRKERYQAAFEAETFSVEAAKDLLFNEAKVRRASTRESPRIVDDQPEPSSAARGESGWWKDFRPQLSPIASMDYDEMSSRGRAPSRWWESQTGSHTDGGGQHVVRSKRESKYMSLSKKLLQDMETGEMDPLPEHSTWTSAQGFPDEKANPDSFGYYDEDFVVPQPSSSYRRTPRPSQLDISRFITLPPPYPRHHPAVNNSHPDLAEYRTTVRMLSDLNDARARQKRHIISIEAMRQDRQKKIADIRQRFRENIHGQIADGSMSYAEAADAERAVKSEEIDLDKHGLQAEFDTLQDVVINPLHDQFNQRVQHLCNSLEALQRELFASAADQDPDQPVQEGNDVPELLEQLTQLKWLFEAREVLHGELFELVSQRNDAYKAIVALPYHHSNNADKIRDTDAFFEKDAATRYATFCSDVLKRHESFLQIVEDNALRGIELQSSAFWDITPGLVDLMQKVPADLDKLDIVIPEEELQENPTFNDHPQQYMYHLLRHAEKSSYQYIEGQINLYCLVHEVKTSSLAAHYKASRAQQKMAGDQSIDLADTRLEDEGELTEELKNRAAMIEEQWQDALGKHFLSLKDRLQKHLVERGAWEDIAAEVDG